MIFGGFTPFSLIDYPGKTAGMVYTIGCNFRCAYCHNPELVDETVETTYPEAFVLSFLEGRQGMLDGLVITGGEPTMHGEKLLSFMKQVKDLGFLVKLDTNGTNPEFITTAIQDGLVDYIAMDVKAPLSTYHRTVSRPVNTGAIHASINLLRNSSIEYEFRTTVIKALLSPENLEKIASEISGAKRYFLQKFVPTNILNPQFKRKVSYTDDEFKAFQETAAKYVEYCGIR
ncbi:MAG: anaerobic ribonucleoside-triphosphate reductase activating protein [Parcubacteria group bacterium]